PTSDDIEGFNLEKLTEYVDEIQMRKELMAKTCFIVDRSNFATADFAAVRKTYNLLQMRTELLERSQVDDDKVVTQIQHMSETELREHLTRLPPKSVGPPEWMRVKDFFRRFHRPLAFAFVA